MVDPLEPRARAVLAAEHALALIALFGSRARGAARPGSDLDVAVLRRDRRRMTLGEIRALAADLASASGLEPDVVDLASADALLRFEIVSHGRVLVEEEVGIWKDLVARTLIDHDDIAPFLPALVAGVGRAARRREGA